MYNYVIYYISLCHKPMYIIIYFFRKDVVLRVACCVCRVCRVCRVLCAVCCVLCAVCCVLYCIVLYCIVL